MLGNVVATTHARVLLSGLDLAMKSYTSPILWVVLKRAGRRVPSASWMRRESVGSAGLTSTWGVCEAVCALDGPAEDWIGADADEESAPGTGDPRRCPPPEKGLYTVFGFL